jgi:hypothetical protein
LTSIVLILAVFCGLAHTVNGFDPVRASGIRCDAARAAIVRVEHGDRGAWNCSRAMHADYELDCRRGNARIQVLERSPVRAVRHGTTVRLANWSFRLTGRTLLARASGRAWITLGRAPFCVPAAPREVLVALRLRPLTPNGGCFTVR